MLVGGASVALSLPFTQCVVPEGITGPVAIYVTNDTQPINNNARDKFIGNIVAGPTMAFIDNKPEVLGQFARPNVAGSANVNAPITAISTQTISPADASQLLRATGSVVAAPTNVIAAPSAVPTVGAIGAVGGSPVAPVAGAPSTAPGFTGPSPDGLLTVIGMQMVPNAPASS